MSMTDTPPDAPLPPPPVAPGAEALSPGNASTVSALAKDYTGKMDALTGDMQKNFEAGEKAQEPYRAKLLEVLNSPQAARAHLEKAADAPKPQDYQKYSMEFASAMAVMGALAGRFTRNAGNASLNAFAGAINGWKQGNLQAYETAAKEWEQNTKKTLENNNIELEKYKEIMADKKLNIDQMMSAMNLVATQYQNKIVFDSTVAKNYTMAFGAVDKMILAQDKLQKSSDKLTQLRADQNAKVSGQVKTLNENPEMLAHMPESDYLKLSGAAEALGLKLNPKPSGGTWKAPSTSAIAQNRQQYINEYTQEHGHPPTSAEITQWEAERAGAKTEASTVARRAGNIAIAVQEAHDTIPNVEAAAAASAGKGLATWNKLENKWKVEKGDENFAYYVQQMNSLINVYGRVISGGGKGTVSDLEHAREMLNPNMPLSAVKGSLRGFATEVDIAEKAPEKVRARMRGTNMGTTPAETTNAPPPDNDGWTVKEK